VFKIYHRKYTQYTHVFLSKTNIIHIPLDNLVIKEEGPLLSPLPHYTIITAALYNLHLLTDHRNLILTLWPLNHILLSDIFNGFISTFELTAVNTVLVIMLRLRNFIACKNVR
jgi:hypothetical protein